MIEIQNMQRLNIVPCYACKAWDTNEDICTLFQELHDDSCTNCYRLIKWEEVEPESVPIDATSFAIEYLYNKVHELERSKLTYGKEKEISNN